MTVIICNREAMAADRQSTFGGVPGVAVNGKIVRLSDGSLLGMGGYDAHRKKIIQLCESFIKGDEITDIVFSGSEASPFVLLRPNGRIYAGETEFKGLEDGNHDVMAIGSGGDFALGAYMAGANLVESVEIAIKCDVYCGGGIDLMELGSKNMTTILDIQSCPQWSQEGLEERNA